MSHQDKSGVDSVLGSFRFFLAASVVMFHLSGHIQNLGQFAVECFYVISGYLITMILVETYHFDLRTFALNRFLRLYPGYYALTLLTLGMWLLMPSMTSFHDCWIWSARKLDYIGNLLIFPWTAFPDQPGSMRFRLLPSTWSVAVEIVCYAILWAFAARRWWTAVIAIALSAGWHGYTIIAGLDSWERYSPVRAATLAFGIGSLAYRAATALRSVRPIWMDRNRLQPAILIVLVGMFLLNWRMSLTDPTATSSPYFYLDILVAAMVCLAFHKFRARGVLGKVDRWLGDLSYPIFLIQYPAGYIAWTLMGSPVENRSYTIAISGLCIAVVASIAVVVFVDHPIIRLRSRVRNEAKRESGRIATA